MAINHGTTKGYHAHRRLNQPPCDACRDAINEYIRVYRAKTGNRSRRPEKARRRALADLRDRHRDEYEQLIREHAIQLEQESDETTAEQEGD